MCNSLGPFDSQDKMVVTEAVQCLDGSLGVFFSFIADEGEASRLAGVLVLKTS